MKVRIAPHVRRAVLPRGGGPETDEAENLRGGSADLNIEHRHDGSDRSHYHVGDDSVRAISWAEALLFGGQLRQEDDDSPHGSGLPSPGIKFMHAVPEALRHIGCMWLTDGREDRRCGKPPAWTMGANLNLARVYCEMHGRLIELRRAQIRSVRKLRRRVAG